VQNIRVDVAAILYDADFEEHGEEKQGMGFVHTANRSGRGFACWPS
jgi:hypothetical protein